MIKLTRASGTELLVNEKFIAIAEETPDTVLTLQNGNKYFIKEGIDEIRAKIMVLEREYRKVIFSGSFRIYIYGQCFLSDHLGIMQDYCKEDIKYHESYSHHRYDNCLWHDHLRLPFRRRAELVL